MLYYLVGRGVWLIDEDVSIKGRINLLDDVNWVESMDYRDVVMVNQGEMVER